MKLPYNPLIVFLSVGYGLFGLQIQMSIALLAFYFLGYLFVRLLISKKEKISLHYYELFFLIYGVLTLLTHMQLIHNPETDYFIHNDACDSFYRDVIDYSLNMKWGSLIQDTIHNPFFVNYPLAAYLFSVLAKVGSAIGIINLRLFLRIHVFMLAAIIPAMMANLMVKYGYDKRNIRKFVLPFALCSYLYVTSSVFTRDLHVCFIYTLTAYYIFIPECKWRMLKFVTLILIATGLRPENGVLLLVPVLGFYFKQSKYKYSRLIIVFFITTALVLFFASSNFLSYGFDKLQYYSEATNRNTGGIFEKINSLPFPLNKIFISIYLLLMPLPIVGYMIGKGGSILTLPFIFSPFIMALLFLSVLFYIFNRFNSNKLISYYFIIGMASYFLIVSTSPDLRRAFAVVPGLYMAYSIASYNIPRKITSSIKRYSWPVILVIHIFFLCYVYL
jgi:hypothetical protein